LEMTAKLSKLKIECSVVAKGLAEPFKSNKPKQFLPVWDKERCIRCGICYIYCPNGAVIRVEDGFFEAEVDSCSACGICHRECLCGAVSMVGKE